jgi:polysaccharide export outer membrane protein
MHGEPKLREGFSVDVVVSVAGTKEVNELSKRVSAKGTLSLPLIGEVTAVPLTLKELGTFLEQMYSEYFVKPKVTVEFSEGIGAGGISPWGEVTVMGRVVRPGKINIPPTRNLTVSGAIQRSGGFASSAKKHAIKVTRLTSRGETKIIVVNLNLLAEGKMGEDIVLYPGDVVSVPEKTF